MKDQKENSFTTKSKDNSKNTKFPNEIYQVDSNKTLLKRLKSEKVVFASTNNKQIFLKHPKTTREVVLQEQIPTCNNQDTEVKGSSIANIKHLLGSPSPEILHSKENDLIEIKKLNPIPQEVNIKSININKVDGHNKNNKKELISSQRISCLTSEIHSNLSETIVNSLATEPHLPCKKNNNLTTKLLEEFNSVKTPNFEESTLISKTITPSTASKCCTKDVSNANRRFTAQNSYKLELNEQSFKNNKQQLEHQNIFKNDVFPSDISVFASTVKLPLTAQRKNELEKISPGTSEALKIMSSTDKIGLGAYSTTEIASVPSKSKHSKENTFCKTKKLNGNVPQPQKNPQPTQPPPPTTLGCLFPCATSSRIPLSTLNTNHNKNIPLNYNNLRTTTNDNEDSNEAEIQYATNTCSESALSLPEMDNTIEHYSKSSTNTFGFQSHRFKENQVSNMDDKIGYKTSQFYPFLKNDCKTPRITTSDDNSISPSEYEAPYSDNFSCASSNSWNIDLESFNKNFGRKMKRKGEFSDDFSSYNWKIKKFSLGEHGNEHYSKMDNPFPDVCDSSSEGKNETISEMSIVADEFCNISSQSEDSTNETKNVYFRVKNKTLGSEDTSTMKTDTDYPTMSDMEFNLNSPSLEKEKDKTYLLSMFDDSDASDSRLCSPSEYENSSN